MFLGLESSWHASAKVPGVAGSKLGTGAVKIEIVSSYAFDCVHADETRQCAAT